MKTAFVHPRPSEGDGPATEASGAISEVPPERRRRPTDAAAYYLGRRGNREQPRTHDSSAGSDTWQPIHLAARYI